MYVFTVAIVVRAYLNFSFIVVGCKPGHPKHQHVSSVRAGAHRKKHKEVTNQNVKKNVELEPTNLWEKCNF